jgi:uncharacterized protein DUF433
MDVLDWLAAGQSEEQILADYPELEPADFRAVFEYAWRRAARRAARLLFDETFRRGSSHTSSIYFQSPGM